MTSSHYGAQTGLELMIGAGIAGMRYHTLACSCFIDRGNEAGETRERFALGRTGKSWDPDLSVSALCSPLAHPSAFGGSSQVSHFSWTVDRKRPKRGVFSSFFSIAGCRLEDGWGWGVDCWWAEEPILVCKRLSLPFCLPLPFPFLPPRELH